MNETVPVRWFIHWCCDSFHCCWLNHQRVSTTKMAMEKWDDNPFELRVPNIFRQSLKKLNLDGFWMVKESETLLFLARWMVTVTIWMVVFLSHHHGCQMEFASPRILEGQFHGPGPLVLSKLRWKSIGIGSLQRDDLRWAVHTPHRKPSKESQNGMLEE